jgi:hypothetical protein
MAENGVNHINEKKKKFWKTLKSLSQFNPYSLKYV